MTRAGEPEAFFDSLERKIAETEGPERARALMELASVYYSDKEYLESIATWEEAFHTFDAGGKAVAIAERIAARSQHFSDAQWNSLCEEDGRTIGQVIGHIADVAGVIHQIAVGIVEQVSYPILSPDWINARNAERAKLAGRLSKEEILIDL